MMCLITCLYLSLGAASMAHPGDAPDAGYWYHDISRPVNPYGTAELGWSVPILANLELEVAARHMSSLGIDWRYGDFNHQFGTNTGEIRLRWYPFR